MNEEAIKHIVRVEDLTSCNVGDIVYVNFCKYKGFIKVKKYDVNDNDCKVYAFDDTHICNLGRIPCNATDTRSEVVFKSLEK